MATNYIYALVDPRTDAVRYIGKSIRPKERLANHLNERSNSWRNHWLRKMRADGVRPVLRILEVVESDDWQTAERRWIAHGRALGWRLTNCTSGGDGVPDLPPDVRARMAAAWTGRKHHPESLKRIGRASRGRKHSIESRARMRAIMTGRKITWVGKVSRGLCRLTAEQFADVHRRLANGEKQYDIARLVGVHKSTISNIHRGKGYLWLNQQEGTAV